MCRTCILSTTGSNRGEEKTVLVLFVGVCFFTRISNIGLVSFFKSAFLVAGHGRDVNILFVKVTHQISFFVVP